MRLTRKAALAGLAPLALAGAAWAAEKPAKPDGNVMEVALPGGGIARISYSGAVAPRVVVGRPAADAPRVRHEAARFAAMDRIMAAMAYRSALIRERMRLRMAALAAQARAGGTRDGNGTMLGQPAGRRPRRGHDAAARHGALQRGDPGERRPQLHRERAGDPKLGGRRAAGRAPDVGRLRRRRRSARPARRGAGPARAAGGTAGPARRGDLTRSRRARRLLAAAGVSSYGGGHDCPRGPRRTAPRRAGRTRAGRRRDAGRADRHAAGAAGVRPAAAAGPPAPAGRGRSPGCPRAPGRAGRCPCCCFCPAPAGPGWR